MTAAQTQPVTPSNYSTYYLFIYHKFEHKVYGKNKKKNNLTKGKKQKQEAHTYYTRTQHTPNTWLSTDLKNTLRQITVAETPVSNR